MDFGINDDGVTNHCNWNTTEGSIKGVDIAQALVNITSSPAFVSEADGDFTTGVADGSVIAGISGVWNAVAVKEAWGSNYGAVKLPTYTCAGQQVQMSSFTGYKMMGVNYYSEHKEWACKLADWLTNEENQFNKTIDQGLRILGDMEEDMNQAGEKTLSGANAFKLYDTYGFPLDLTKEILEEKGYQVDEDGFKAAMDEQRKKARDAREVTNYMGADATVYDQIDTSVTTEFVGYDHLTFDSKVTVLTTETEVVSSLMEGQKGTVFVEQTPFYATMGGQVGDTGVIQTANGRFVVEDTIKLRGGKFGHVGYMESGMISEGETVSLIVDSQARKDTEKNHSATHLLQKALKAVLGAHVEQKGSLVTPDRLRFDFAHFQAMTSEELSKVEDLVNEKIQASLPVNTNVMDIEEAKKSVPVVEHGEFGADMKVSLLNDGPFTVILDEKIL